MLALSFCVSATEPDFNITVGENFISAHKDENLDEISKQLNIDTSELNSYFNKNGMLYLAVSTDNSIEIRLSAFTDNFSAEIIDLSYLDNEQTNEFVSAFAARREVEPRLVENGGRKYIEVVETLTDSGGVYTSTQYITVCGGKSYYLSFYNSGEKTSQEVREIFASFTLNAPKQSASSSVTIVLIIGIVISAALAVFAVVGIIKKLILSGLIKNGASSLNE